MRIGTIFSAQSSNLIYRSVFPLLALERAGHQIVFAQKHNDRDEFSLLSLLSCDVVLVYRRADPDVVRAVDELRRRGVATIWDNDDDTRLMPDSLPESRQFRGIAGHREVRTAARMRSRVDLITTTTAPLAELFRQDCSTPIEIVENFVADQQFASPSSHDGFVIGWVARLEHIVDAKALRISEVLANILEENPTVRVETIGRVNLKLPSDRYDRTEAVSFSELPKIMNRWDLGIAPISDMPMSYARSDIKVKEYAAAGVPWLASARGSYLGLGPKCGGQLVEDDGWEQALKGVVGSSSLKLRMMRRRAKSWATRQRIDRHVGRWEQAMRLAMAEAAARRAEEPARA
jgi:glycosyltransferase involved in cell wall biosynthesis